VTGCSPRRRVSDEVNPFPANANLLPLLVTQIKRGIPTVIPSYLTASATDASRCTTRLPQ
jgi:hypothetical protein